MIPIRRTSLLGCLLFTLIPGTQAADTLYMGAPVKLVTASNGAIVNQSVMDNAKLVKPQNSEAYEITKNVWVLPGASINAALIVGPEGLIVWESGENMRDGEHYLAAIRRISDKPIKAVIYSHAHYTFGTQALLKDSPDALVIGHPNLNANMQTGGLGSYFPETEPVQWGRTLQHLQMYLPKQGPDAKYGFQIDLGERGFVPVNTPVEHGQELQIAGVKLRFLTRGGSDTDDCIAVWLPEQKVALNNVVWPWQPNFYTPRGAKFRDPRVWITALKDLRDLQPEYLINQHAISVTGREQVTSTINNYLDMVNLVLDQTLRGILQGKGPEELRDFIKLPEHMKQNPWLFESYGQTSWYAPYIMNHAMGWWDGDAASLIKLPPKDVSERLVPLLGGRDKLLSLVREAQAKGELAWALELLNHQYRLTPDDAEVRQLKADMLRKSAQISTASITRAFMLSQALALEGKVKVPTFIPPRPEQITANPASFVDQKRVYLDPEKAQHADTLLRFDFSDAQPATAALHIRRGVAEFIAAPDQYPRQADIRVKLSSANFAALYLGQQSLEQLLDSGHAQLEGDRTAAVDLLALFDPLKP